MMLLGGVVSQPLAATDTIISANGVILLGRYLDHCV